MLLSRDLSLPAEPAHVAVAIGVGRAALGAVIMAAPALSLRVLGADSATARRVNWLARMTGVRDGVLGAGTASAARAGGSAAVPWLLAGAVADLVDGVSTADALRKGRLRGPLPAAMVGLAAGSAGLGAITALRLRRSR